MKATFNAVCHKCKRLKPHCVLAYLSRMARGTFGGMPRPLCADCRRAARGQFRLDPRHDEGE